MCERCSGVPYFKLQSNFGGTFCKKIKVKDQSVQKIDWKQTDRWTRPIALPFLLTRSVHRCLVERTITRPLNSRSCTSRLGVGGIQQYSANFLSYSSINSALRAANKLPHLSVGHSSERTGRTRTRYDYAWRRRSCDVDKGATENDDLQFVLVVHSVSLCWMRSSIYWGGLSLSLQLSVDSVLLPKWSRP